MIDKNVLMLHRHSPRHNHVQEAFDITLMFAAFDQKVSLAFMDDGVWQLVKDQNSAAVDKKSIVAMYQSLEIYDVKNIYVETESLNKRGLVIDDLVLPAVLLSSKEFSQMLRQQDVFLSW